MSNNRIVTSPSERVQALSDSFKDVLSLGQRYVDLLDQLAQTKDAKNLLSATNKLAKLTWRMHLLIFHHIIKQLTII